MLKTREILLEDIVRMHNMLLDTAKCEICPVPLQIVYICHNTPDTLFYFPVFSEREGGGNEICALVLNLQLFIDFCNTPLPPFLL